MKISRLSNHYLCQTLSFLFGAQKVAIIYTDFSDVGNKNVHNGEHNKYVFINI